MSQLGLLSKNFIRASLAVSKKKGNQNSSYIAIISIALLFMVATTVGSILFYHFNPSAAGPNGGGFVLLLLVIAAMSVLTLLISIFQMSATLFRSKDFDFLCSLPVKSHNVVLAKLIAIGSFDLFLTIAGMIPVLIIYMIKGGTAIGFGVGLVGTLLCPLIPLAISVIFGALVSVITAKSVHRELFTIVLYIVFLVAYMGLIAALMLKSSEMLNFYQFLPYLKWLEDAIKTNNFLPALWFILSSIGALAVVVILSSILYLPLNQMKQVNAKTEYKLGGNVKMRSLDHVLFKKEVDSVTHNSLYLMSTYLYPLIFLILGIFNFGIFAKGFSPSTPEIIESVQRSIMITLPTTGLLLASFASTTYASFSLEGNNFALLHVYPVSKNRIIKSKIKASLFPFLIFFPIASAIIGLIVSAVKGFGIMNYVDWINLIIIPMFGLPSATFIGALCGLRWIKLDYNDQNDVLKKSKAAGFTFLFSGLINVVAIVGVFVLFLVLDLPSKPIYHRFIPTAILVGYYIIVNTILVVLIENKSEKLFDQALTR